jgi:pimeloyl-ACP methyl ester carboxylesterase
LPQIRRLQVADGTEIAVHEWGAGRPVVLLHGFMTTAPMLWERTGHAQRLVDAGFRVIAPDLRGHGSSGAPRDPGSYPADVLTDDALEIVERLGLADYDLGGYSLGARTAARMLLRGATPRRAVLGGTGLAAVVHGDTGRSGWYTDLFAGLGTFARDSDKWSAQQYLRATRADPAALQLVLKSSSVSTDPDALARLRMPILVLVGDADHHREAAGDLVARLPDARLAVVPGDHIRAATSPELGRKLVEHLTA